MKFVYAFFCSCEKFFKNKLSFFHSLTLNYLHSAKPIKMKKIFSFILYCARLVVPLQAEKE